MTHIVDEETWRSVHPAPDSAQEVFADARAIGSRQHFCHQAPGIQSKFGRGCCKIVLFQRFLIVVQRIVHLPEFLLCARSFGGFSRRLSVWMNLGEWKM